MINITNEPADDFDRYARAKDKELDELPICTECGDHIIQDFALKIGGLYYCDRCIEALKVSI